MLVSYIIWTACSAVNQETGSTPAGIVVIVCVFVVFFHSDIAWTPLLLGYPTEIFPYYLRSKGLAIEMVSVYSFLVIAAFCNPIGLETIGSSEVLHCLLLFPCLHHRHGLFLLPGNKRLYARGNCRDLRWRRRCLGRNT